MEAKNALLEPIGLLPAPWTAHIDPSSRCDPAICRTAYTILVCSLYMPSASFRFLSASLLRAAFSRSMAAARFHRQDTLSR